MAEPGHSSSNGAQAPSSPSVKPEGRGSVWTRARLGLDRRLCGLSQKLSIATALLLCATPLLLVHARAPAPQSVASAPDGAAPPPAQTPAIEIVRTRPVTTAAAPAPQAAGRPPAPASSAPGGPPPPAAAAPKSGPPPEAAPASPVPVAPATPPAWTEAEIAAARQQCASLLGPLNVTLQEMPPLKQDKCGTPAPVALKRLSTAAGSVELTPPAILNCAMVAQLDQFVEKALQPAAREAFGSPVVRFNQASGYVCRGRNGDVMANGKMSEHALANALDVASFTLADGRVIDVGKHWGPAARDFKNTPPPPMAQTSPPSKGSERSALGAPVGVPPPTKASAPDAAATKTKEALFLRRVHQSACALFGTVLGPEANEAHREHFHLDLHPRRHSNYCH